MKRFVLKISLLLFAFVAVITVFALLDNNHKYKNIENTAMAQDTPQFYEGTVNAPDFPQGLEWLNTDKPLSIKELKGKVVVLDFWTYCCINCIHVIPDLKKLEKKYPNELVVIGVHSAKFKQEKDTENIRNAILRYEIEHLVINDKDFKVWNSYAVHSWPTLVIIAPNGKVIGVASGEGIYDDFDRIIAGTIKHFDAKNEMNRIPMVFGHEKTGYKPSGLSYPGKLTIYRDTLYISDSNNNRIVVVDIATNTLKYTIGSGELGNSDGTFDNAQFDHPQGVVVNSDNPDILYIADTENHVIKEADLKSKTVKTIAGTGKQAREFNISGKSIETALNSPWDIVYHDKKLYIAMAGPHQLWVLDLATDVVKPYAGSGREDIVDGYLKAAALAQPSGITISPDKTKLYFADSEVSAVRSAELNPLGRVETLIGHGLFDFGDIDGEWEKARLQHCLGVLAHDDKVYVADTYNNKVKEIDLKSRTIKTVAGTGERGYVENDDPMKSKLYEPSGLAIYKNSLYIADTNNHVIRILDLATNKLSTLKIKDLQPLAAKSDEAKAISLGEIRYNDPKTIEIEVSLPKNNHLNKEAPNNIEIIIGNLSYNIGIEKLVLDGEVLSFDASLVKLADNADVSVNVDVYYCEDKTTSGICSYKSIKANFKLKKNNNITVNKLRIKI